MTIETDVIDDFKAGCQSARESLKNALGKLRTGRANIGVLDGVRVDYYGTMTPLTQCANMSTPDARMITVKPWDRALIPAIEKAIASAGLGFNPQNDGEIIRLPVPSLTEDRRKDLVKQAKARGEDAKISVRNARRDANEMLKAAEKDKELSEDDLKRALESIQTLTDEAVKEVDATLVAKEAEIMEI